MVSTEEKVTEERMPLGWDLQCEGRVREGCYNHTHLYTEGYNKLVTLHILPCYIHFVLDNMDDTNLCQIEKYI